MNVSYKLFLFASLCFFTSCYKQKACFRENISSGEIFEEIGECQFASSQFSDIKTNDDCFLYINEDSYLKDISKNNICDLGSFDFVKYSILYARIKKTDNSFVSRYVKIDTANKKIFYTIISTKSVKRRFLFYGLERINNEILFLKIPKIDSTFTLVFTNKEVICH